MVDETDISQEKSWLYEERAKVAVANLQKKNIHALYVPSQKEALAAILGMIPPGAVVYRGDSVTLDQIGIEPELVKRGQNKVVDPKERDEQGLYRRRRRDRLAAQREAFSADIYLSGTNAVTLDGKLVAVDGIGDRVAPLIFGPSKVILVAGANKLVKNVDEALERIHRIAAPLNAKRHFIKHHAEELTDLPCVRTGQCVDCNSDNRICRYTTIIEGTMARDKGRINVVLVGEDLGL